MTHERPQSDPRGRQIGPGGVQDGLGIVLVRFSCRIVVRFCLFGRLRVVLGLFWGAPGAVGGHFGGSWALSSGLRGRFGLAFIRDLLFSPSPLL